MDDWLGRRAITSDVPGFVVAVHNGRQLVYNRAFGYANLQTKEVLTTKHLFPVCSQSKMITATAIMRLVDDGRIKLTDKASKHVNWLMGHPRGAVHSVAIQQILWHGAGFIRDGQDADYWQLARQFPDSDELRGIIMSSRPSQAQHMRVKYSNIGYAVLGSVIESASGQEYAEYCRSTIIEPFDLRSLCLAPACDGQLFAAGHTRWLGGERLTTPAFISTNALAPSVGWHAQAQDMAKFLAVHMCDDDRMLSALSKRRMHMGIRNHWLPRKIRGSDYGLGFQTYSWGDIQVIGHGGTSIGHRSKTFHDSITGLTVAIMSNAKDAPIAQMAAGLTEVCRYFVRHGQTPVPDRMKRYNVCLAGSTSTIQVTTVGKKVITIFPDSWQPLTGAEELRYVGSDTFVVSKASDMAAAGEPVRFEFDGDGKVQSVNYTGCTLLSEQAYNRWLKRNLKKWHTQTNPDILE